MRPRKSVLCCLFAAVCLVSGCTMNPPNAVAPEDLNLGPLVRIDLPDWGTLFAAGDTVTFRGKVLDVENESTSLEVTWVSNVDGTINTSPSDSEGTVSFWTAGLSYSPHVITLSAVDADGNVGRDSVVVYNNVPPPVTLFELEKDLDSVYVTWSRATAPDFARYNVYRSTNSGAGTDGELIQTTETLTDTTYQDTAVVVGGTYYYQVFVESAAGQISGSEERTINAGFFTVVDLNINIGTIQPGPNSQYVFASDLYNDRVLVIGIESGEVDYEIEVGDSPLGLAVNPDRNELYVANSNDSYISVIDIVTMTALSDIPLSIEPAYLAYSPISGRLYATSANTWEEPSIVDVVNGVEIGVIVDPSYVYSYAMCEASEVSPFLYIGIRGLSPASLYKVDISTDNPWLVLDDDHGSIGSNLQGMDLSTDGTAVFLACGAPYYVQMLSTDTFAPTGSFDTGAYPTAVAVAPDGATVYTGHGTDEVQVFDVATGVEISHFAVPDEVDDNALAIDPTGAWLFVAIGYYHSTSQDLVIVGIRPE